LKEEKICYKMVYYTLHIYVKPIVRHRVSKSESDLMPARASLSGFAVPYHFSITHLWFRFQTCAGTCFMSWYQLIWHLKG